MGQKCVVSIVKKGLKDKMMEAIKPLGLEGSTVIPARGTVSPTLYESLFGLHYDPHRDLILNVVEEAFVAKVLERFDSVVNYRKANQGIAFVLDVEEFKGLFEVEPGGAHV
jgi:nitrogen regulatory protein PII